MYIILDGMYVTMCISTGLCPDWDLWTANKLQLQSFQSKFLTSILETEVAGFAETLVTTYITTLCLA
jgi:hypothetical protein